MSAPCCLVSAYFGVLFICEFVRFHRFFIHKFRAGRLRLEYEVRSLGDLSVSFCVQKNFDLSLEEFWREVLCV
jgi:hypothetical protein